MIYLDHNATTPLDAEVLREMEPYMRGAFGNPSSPYGAGRAARAAVDEARGRMAEFLGCEPSEVIWTSGATEANTMAIRSAVGVSEKRHVVTTNVEHHAVSEVVEQLQREGCPVTRVPVDEGGAVDPAAVAAAIRPETALVTVMGANNETGVVMPIEEIGRICRDRGVPFHVDAVQVAGKQPVNLSELAVDSAAFSAHKFYGPKGVGALFLRRRQAFLPMMPGGGQERGRRGGTENVAGIVGMGAAARRAGDVSPMKRLTEWRDRMEARLLHELGGIVINGKNSRRLGNTSNLSVDGVDGEALLLKLDQSGVAVSTGSACATGAMEPSHVLLAMGRSRREALSSIRISLGRSNTVEDVENATERIVDAVRSLRKLGPGG